MRVIIYEDNILDIKRRYSSLNGSSNHEVEILYHLGEDDFLKGAIAYLKKTAGFKPEQIKAVNRGEYVTETSSGKDTIHIFDGLNGACWEYIRGLPSERVIINSGNPQVVREAERRELRVLRDGETIEEVIESMTSENNTGVNGRNLAGRC